MNLLDYNLTESYIHREKILINIMNTVLFMYKIPIDLEVKNFLNFRIT